MVCFEMGIKNVLDLGLPDDQIWTKFTSYVIALHPAAVDYKIIRHCIDIELKQYKATWVTDHVSYSKIYFENAKYKTAFLLRWS